MSTLSRICAHTCGLDFPASLTDVEETNCLENANTRRHFTIREKQVLAEKASRKIIRGVQIVENQVVVKRANRSLKFHASRFTGGRHSETIKFLLCECFPTTVAEKLYLSDLINVQH